MYGTFVDASVIVVIKEEKLLTVLVFPRSGKWLLIVSGEFPYPLIAAVSIPQAERNFGGKRDSFRIQYSFTVQLSGRNGCDITRMKATE